MEFRIVGLESNRCAIGLHLNNPNRSEIEAGIIDAYTKGFEIIWIHSSNVFEMQLLVDGIAPAITYDNVIKVDFRAKANKKVIDIKSLS